MWKSQNRRSTYWGAAFLLMLCTNGVFAQKQINSQKIVVQVESKKEELSGKELLQKIDWNIAGTMEKETGLHKRSMGPAPSRPVYHGLQGEHIQVSEEGMNVLDLSATSPDHAVNMNMGHVNNLKIVTGADLLAYNLSSIGLRIEADRNLLSSRCLNESGLDVMLGVQSQPWGSMGALNQHLLWSEQWCSNFQLGGSYLQNAITPSGTIENTQSQAYDLAVAQVYSGVNHKIAVGFKKDHLQYGIPGGFTGGHLRGVDIRMEGSAWLLKYQWLNSRDTISWNNSWQKFYQVEKEGSGRVGAEFLVNSLQSELKWQRILKEGLSLESGVAYHLDQREYGGFVYTPQTTRHKWALFSIWTYGGLSYWKLALRSELNKDYLRGKYSVRQGSDLPERKFPEWSGHLSYFWKINPTLNLEFSSFYNHRIPTVEELYNQGPHLAAYSYDTGNPELPAEEYWGTQINSQWDQKRVRFKTRFFGHVFKHLVYARPNGDTNWSTGLPVYQMSSGKAYSFGGDLSAIVKINSNFKWKTQGDFVYRQDLDRGLPVSATPPPRWNNSLIWHKNYHETSLVANYIFPQNRVSDFELKTKEALVWNWFYNYTLLWNKKVWRVVLGVENLLDNSWKNHLSRIREIYEENGRKYSLKLKLSL